MEGTVRGPSAGPVDVDRPGSPEQPLSPTEFHERELKEKGRAALRARLFASQSKPYNDGELRATFHSRTRLTGAWSHNVKFVTSHTVTAKRASLVHTQQYLGSLSESKRTTRT